MLLSSIINLGVNQASGTQAFKIKITNIVSLLACLLPTLYALYFYFSLGSSFVATLNIFFVFVYSLSLLMSYLGYYRSAKIWLLVVLMSHVFILSTQIFTSASGFHFYYLLLPSGVFLLFDEEQKFEKSLLMTLGVILFFICDGYNNTTPLIDLSRAAEKIIFLSTILVVMLEIYLVMFVFSRAITQNEIMLKHIATKDSLTGVNNRRTFIEVGQELLEQARRYEKPLSLLMIDIDYFKKINDSYGHVFGDHVLKTVANLLNNNIRVCDTLARFGGEEFVIILPETTGEDAVELAEKLRVLIEHACISYEGEQTINCTVSIGVAQFDAEIENLNELINRADIALYRAKETGRNKALFFET